VHTLRLGEAQRAADESLDPGPQIDMFALDFLRVGVPVANVQETTIRELAVKTVEENEGLRPHIRWTKIPDFVHVYRGISRMNWVCFPTAAVRRAHSTPARRILQRDQEIQSLPKDRCFLLQNCGNPNYEDSLIKSSHQSKSHFYKVGEFMRQKRMPSQDLPTGALTTPLWDLLSCMLLCLNPVFCSNTP
jgi:hypothetical protein